MRKQCKRIVAAALCLILLVSSAATGIGVKASTDTPDEIYCMKVNSCENPLGIDTNPVFSWKIRSDGYGKSQSAYRIIVASSPEKAQNGNGDLWDSGKVKGDTNYGISYAGDELISKTEYFWTVEIWDETDRPVAKSAVSAFSTGIFQDSEWEGDWISFPSPKYKIDLGGCSWIWKRNGAAFESAPGGTEYFRKSFTTDPSRTIESVVIGFTADNQAQLYFNGTDVGGTSSWSSGVLAVVTDSVNPTGNNSVAIAATNDSVGYAGMIAKIVITYTDKTTEEIVSDKSWKVSTDELPGWSAQNYDDSSWQKPDQSVAFGASPWNSGVALDLAGSRAATILRREFEASGAVARAVAYVSGLGLFDMKINGQNPDDTVLNPSNTQYDKTVPYRTFDVTALISRGKNAVAVELGNGFFNETGGAWNWADAAWRDDPKLLLNLELTYTDGSKEMIKTGTDWSATKDGPCVYNSIYFGETYDSRKEQEGCFTPGFDDSSWEKAVVAEKPGGILKCQIMDPIRRTDEIAPESITDLGDGKFVITAARMTTGWIKLRINAPAGTEITVDYSERLNDDGSVMKLGNGQGVDGNWSSGPYAQHDTYIANGRGAASFEPKYSYKGFKYIQIENYPGRLTADDFTIYKVRSDVDIVSDFSSSSRMINELHNIMQNTMLNNFQGKPTDTPVYEKNGWLGDANVALDSMMYNFDMSNFLPDFIEIMEDCWNTFGTVPSMVPTAGAFIENCYVWNTIFVNGVDAIMNHYGDISYVEEQYDVMRRFILKDIAEIKANGWVGQDGGFSDWAGPVGGSDPDAASNWNVSEGAGICGTAFVYSAIQKMADFADRLGKTQDAEEYRLAMANMYKAFNNKFYNKEKKIYETTVWNQIGSRTVYRQTSNLVALAFGLVPEENIDGVVNNLLADIKAKDCHLDTGIVGTKLILPVLAEYGYADVAYKILTQKTYPGWGHWLEMGSTSTWEGYENTVRSFGHYFLGTYDEFLFSGLAGVKDIQDGYKTFTVEPDMIGGLNFVTYTADTVRGPLESSWSLNDDGTATMKITVPYGARAKVMFPTARIRKVKIGGKTISTELEGVAGTGFENGRAYAELLSGTYELTAATEQNVIFRDSLNDAIAESKKLSESDYTPALWGPFKNALAHAETVYSDPSANQKQINDAALTLESAMLSLGGSRARNELKALIESIESQKIDGTLYGALEFARLQSALTTARSLAFNYFFNDDAGLNQVKATLSSAYNKLIKSNRNLAKGKKATALSSEENGGWGWGKKNLTDGDRKNSNPYNEYAGYSSKGNASSDSVEWVYIDLGEKVQFDNVVLYGSCGSDLVCHLLPVDFEIQVSDNHSDWTTVHRETGLAAESYGPLKFSFDRQNARYIRLYVTRLGSKPSESNTYRVQLTELEVYNSGAQETPEKGDYLLYLELDNNRFLTPVFDFDVHEYSAMLEGDNPSVSIKPIATDGARVYINGEETPNGMFSQKIPLNYGENVITVTVGGVDTLLKITRQPGSVTGDLDRDGKVTVSDVVILRKAIVDGNVSDEILLAGDMDGDGKLTVSDVVELRKKIVRG